MSVLPSVGLLALPGSPPAFLALLRSLAPWCRVQAAHPGDPSPAAWLASSPACPGLAAVGRPYAVWVDGMEAFERAGRLEPSPRVVATADPALIGPAVLFPEQGLDLRSYLPIPPVIRRRWRTRLGLPDTLVVDARPESRGAPPADLLPTALAVASVVIASNPSLVEALAWAAPCVTDSASAGALGARPGDVLIGQPSHFEELALMVAEDDATAAALSRAGHRLVERRADRHRPAHRVAEALGLTEWGEHPSTGPARRALDGLHTPADAPIRARTMALVTNAR